MMNPPGPIFSFLSIVGGGYLGWKLATWQQSRTQQRILEIYGPEDRTYWSESMKDKKVMSIESQSILEGMAENKRQFDKLKAMMEHDSEEGRKRWERRDRGTEVGEGVEQLSKEKQEEVDEEGVGSSLV